MSEDNTEALADRMWRLRWGWHRYWGKDPDQAIGMLEEAIKIAEQLQKPLVIMECRHWIAQLLIFQKRNYAKALPMAIESVVEARKPLYQNWHMRICLYQDLIVSYAGTDAVSNAPAIEKALEHMLTEAQPGSQCMSCLLGERVDFEYRRGNVSAARTAAQKWYTEAQSDDHRSAAQNDLAHYAILNGEYTAAIEHTNVAIEQAEKADRADTTAEALLWQAVAHAKLGDFEKADACFSKSEARLIDYTALLSLTYWEARATYFEEIGDLEKAVSTQEEHLKEIDGLGAVREEAVIHIELCRLHKKGGTLAPALIEQTQERLNQLKVADDLQERFAAIVA